MFLSDISIRRPVFATMMMVALVVLGVVSFRRLSIDEYPDITYPVVSVRVSLPGASPESMMRDVSKPLEEALKLGLSCGAANAMTELAGHVRREDVEQLQRCVNVQSMSS